MAHFGILTRNTSSNRHTSAPALLETRIHACILLFIPCKSHVFFFFFRSSTRESKWKLNSRGPVINVRVNSRLVRDRKIVWYGRDTGPGGVAQKIIKSIHTYPAEGRWDHSLLGWLLANSRVCLFIHFPATPTVLYFVASGCLAY